MPEESNAEMTSQERTIAALALSVRFVAEALTMASPLHGHMLINRLDAALDQTDDIALSIPLRGLRDCVAQTLSQTDFPPSMST